MNDTSRPPRSRRTSSAGHQSAQVDPAPAGGQGPFPKKGKSGIQHLLEIGRHRDIFCFTDESAVNALFTRRIKIHQSGKIVNALFVYPIEDEADFEEGENWMNEFWPLTDGGADA